MTQTWSDILYEKDPPIARVIWNRPEKRNAIRRPQSEEQYAEALQVATDDDDIKVIILKGRGTCFSAGHDVTPGVSGGGQRNNMPHWKRVEALTHDGSVIRAAWTCPKPVIAQVHGYCLGGATSIVLNCDFIVCADDAKFGHPAMRAQGAGPDDGGMWVWNVGPQWAKRQLFTGDAVDAETALRIGWVTEVVPLDKLEETVETLARRIANVPMHLLYLNKRFVNRTIEAAGTRQIWALSPEYLGISGIDPEVQEFRRLSQEQGVRAALKFRDSPMGDRGGVKLEPPSSAGGVQSPKDEG